MQKRWSRFTTRPAGTGLLSIEIDVPLVDPIGRVRSPRWTVRRDNANESDETREEAGVVPLSVTNGRASGSLRVDPRGRVLILSFRIAWLDGSGRTIEEGPH